MCRKNRHYDGASSGNPKSQPMVKVSASAVALQHQALPPQSQPLFSQPTATQSSTAQPLAIQNQVVQSADDVPSVTQELLAQINALAQSSFSFVAPIIPSTRRNSSSSRDSSSSRKRFRPNDPDIELDPKLTASDELESLRTLLGLEQIDDSEQTPGMRNLEKMMTHLLVKVSRMSDQMDKISGELTEVRNFANNLALENHSLRQQNADLQRQINENQIRAEEEKRLSNYRHRMANDYSRANNLVLHDGPLVKTEKETLEALFAVTDKLGVSINEDDIDVCHPLPSRDGKNRIVYRFIQRRAKHAIVAAARKSQLFSKQFKWAGKDRRIYASDHLSPETAKLLAAAKTKLSAHKQGPFAFVWAKMGRVLVKNPSDDRPIEIRWLEDIDDVLLKHGGARGGVDHMDTHYPADSEAAKTNEVPLVTDQQTQVHEPRRD